MDKNDGLEEMCMSWMAGISGAGISMSAGVSLRSSSRSASCWACNDEAEEDSWSMEVGGMSMSLVRVEVHSMTCGAFSLKSIEWRPVLLAPGLVAGVRKLVDVDSPSPNAPCVDAMVEKSCDGWM